MATTLYDVIVPEVMMATTAGCPDILVVRELRNTAIEFFSKSLCWRMPLDPIVVVPSIASYSLISPVGDTRVARIYNVAMSVQPAGAVAPYSVNLLPKLPQELDLISPNWRVAQPAVGFVPNMQTHYYTQDSLDSIVLAGVPQVTGTLSVLASVVPTRASTGIDNIVLEQYFEALVNGAKARLLAMPDKAWSNAALVSYHQDLFERAIANASAQSAKAFQSHVPLHTRKYLR